MDSQQYWFSSGAGDNSGGGGGDDFGAPIGQSLRFRGGQVLTRPVSSPGSTSWTLSLWVKKCEPHGWLPLFTPRDNRSGSVGLQFSIGSPANIGYQTLEVGGAEGSTAQYRDPSAWYHVVCQCNRDTSLLTIYVNGDQVVQGPTTDQMDFADNMRFMHGQTGFDTNTGHFYLADTYLIDGQSLEPTAFGRLTEKGVWVPKKVDFAIGQTKYSDYVSSVPSGDYFSDRTPDRMFKEDKDASTGETTVNNLSDTLIFRPSSPIPYTSSVEVYTGMSSGTGTIYFNDPTESGGGTDPAPAQYVTVATGSGEITEIRIKSGSTKANCAGIAVDGVQLLDPYQWSTDLTADTGFQGGLPPSGAFDGDTSSTQAGTNGQGASMVFSPSNELNVTELAIYTGMVPGTLEWNGNSVTTVQNGWTVITDTGVLNASTPMTLTADASSTCTLYAVRVNGSILIDGINNSYGPNGFHLNFSDPTNVGRDFSGNGNDFTANGFVGGLVTPWQDTSVYSDAYTDVLDWTTTEKDSLNIASWKNGFDGNLDTYAFGDNSSGAPINETWLQFRPPSPIQVNTSARIYLQYPHGCKIIDASNNETTIAVQEGNINYWQDLNFTGLLKGIAVQSSTGYAARWAAIEIDGQILLSIPDIDYDVMKDSPTQNYTTGNSIHVNDYTNSTLSKGNLEWAAQGTSQRSTTQTLNRGKWYWEATPVTGVTDKYPQVSFGSLSNNISANSVAFGGSQYYDYTDGSPAWKNYDAAMVINQPQGYAYDSETGTITITNINGEVTTHVFNGGATGMWRDDGGDPLGVYASPTSGEGLVLNFGQQAFTFDVPEGYLPLQSQNSTAKSILNGRDHFQALTGPGDGPAAIDPATQIYVNSYQSGPLNASTPASNGFNGDLTSYVWADYNVNGLTQPMITFNTPMTGTKFEIYVSVLVANNLYVNGQINSPGPINGGWVDISAQAAGSLSTLGFTASGGAADGFAALRIDDKVVIESGILARAQATFPNGFWWIKDRANDNQHQLLDSVRGGDMVLHTPSTGYEDPYQAPAGDSVAWCWNAGGPAVTNNDGTIETQVSANTESGFSIITYTGDGNTGATLGHGLTQGPNFVICKSRVSGQNFAVGSTHIDNWGTALYLNNNQAKEPTGGGGFWNNTAPDNTVITLGNHPNVNTSGQNTVCYAWHEVPGYSAFGSYSGNTDADGPFVYTGFKVAFLLFKRTEGAYAWEIRDTTRTPNNPSNFTLYPNESWQEAGPDPSTDVDLLSNGFKLRNATVNGNGGNVIYAAFAENPFHYPVTAR